MKGGKKSDWGLKNCVGAVLFCLCLAASLEAASAAEFRASDGAFAIHLPDGWALQTQAAPTVYVFKGSGIENVVVEYFPGANDVNALLGKGLTTAQASGLSNMRVQELNEITVNDRPAAWGYYTGVFTQNNVALNAALGAVVLPKGGLYFLSILNDGSKASMGPAIEKSFWSIR